MVEEKTIGTAPNAETTNSNWEDDYTGDRPTGDSAWFSDTVPEGKISYTTTITFKDEGKKASGFKAKPVIRFLIEHEGKEKNWDVNPKQWEILQDIAKAKPLTGKKASITRTGKGQLDTRRQIEFLGEQ
jgi:hypothetical protein